MHKQMDNKEIVKEKMDDTVSIIIRDIVRALTDFSRMNQEEFFQKYTLAKPDLSNFNPQQLTLYKKIIDLAYADLELIALEKEVSIKSAFEFIKKQTKNPKIKDELLEVIAYPHVKQFIDTYTH